MRNVILIAVCACGVGASADAPYAGKWKMNVAKTDFGETTVTYEQLPAGEMKMITDGLSYNFKTDSKDNATPWGMTMAWKELAPGKWEITEKTGAKVTATSALSLSADGKALLLSTKRAKADGGVSDDSMTFQRVSGGPGLVGKWKTKILKTSSPETMSLTPSGSDGLAVSLGNEGAICDAKFDGKDHPAKGPLWPAGWACRIVRNGERAFDITWKRDGKDLYTSTLAASSDGKSLTETGSAVGTGEKFKIVYDRQ